jgi:hypothetical protein
MLNYTEKTPKHLYPKLHVLEDNGYLNCGFPSGPRTIAISRRSYLQDFLLEELRAREYSCDCWEKCNSSNVHADTRMHCQHIRKPPGRRVTSPLNIPVWCIALRSVSNMARMRAILQFYLIALCHSQFTLMKSTDINITETIYSCRLQHEFGNQ